MRGDEFTHRVVGLLSGRRRLISGDLQRSFSLLRVSGGIGLRPNGLSLGDFQRSSGQTFGAEYQDGLPNRADKQEARKKGDPYSWPEC
jgi:hypothetical protein